MKELEFRVRGLPAPQGSKTLTRYGALMESSKKVKPWRQDIIHAALAEFLKKNAPYFCTSKKNGDIDKLCRSTFDGLSVSSGGSIIMDDSLIVAVKAWKRYAIFSDACGGAIIKVKTFDRIE